MRMLAVAALCAALSLPCEAQTTLQTPPAGTLRTKAQRTKFHLDSLRFEYPILVDSSKRPMKAYECWRVTDIDNAEYIRQVQTNKRAAGLPMYEFRRLRQCFYGAAADTALDYGNLHTYFRGAWKNQIQSERPGVVIYLDGTRSRSAAAKITTE